MKKTGKKLLALIILLNSISIIFEGITVFAENKNTVIDNSIGNDRLELMKKRGVITVITPIKDIAYFYKDDQTNEISGIDADIVREIAKRLEIDKVEMKETTFPNLLEKLNTDDSIDILVGGIYITPKREEIISFTEPLYKGSEVIVVPKFSEIHFKSDLKDAVIGVEKGTAFIKLIKKWKKDNVIKDIMFFETPIEILNAINNNKIDGGMIDSTIAKYFFKKDKNLQLRILRAYVPEEARNIGIGIRKNDITLLNAFNEKIDEMKKDGTLYAILIKNGLDKKNMP